MLSRLEKTWLSAAAAAPAGPPPEEAYGSLRMSPVAWVVAAVLLVAAIYLLIRLLEWDLINRDTEDQDDPLQDATRGEP